MPVVTATVAPTAVELGTAVTLSALVKSSRNNFAVLHGSVEFFEENDNSLGSAPVMSGAASISKYSLSVGTHTVTAHYTGTAGYYQDADSAGVQLTVAPPPRPTTVLLSSDEPIVNINAPIVVTATVSTEDGSTPTGTIMLTWQGHDNYLLALNEQGQASFTFYNGSAATLQFDAVYLGDVGFQGSSSNSLLVQTANLNVETLTTLDVSSAALLSGQAVSFTARTKEKISGANVLQGSVEFFDGQTSLGTGTLSNGVAVLTTDVLSVGDHTITARFGGDPLFFLGSDSAALRVNVASAPRATTTVLSTPSPYVQLNTPFTVTVTVTSEDGSIPTGQVWLIWQGHQDMVLTLDATGKVSVPFSTGNGDNQGFDAKYLGTPAFMESWAAHLPVTITNLNVESRAAISASATAVVAGQEITFTAEVKEKNSEFFIPQGTVEFYDGQQLLGSSSIADGIAKLKTSQLPAGTHNVTAHYVGVPYLYVGSDSAAVTVDVNERPRVTTTVLSTPSANVQVGEVLTVSVTVTSDDGAVPTGNVEFVWQNHAVYNLALSHGQATFQVAYGQPESMTFTANYQGAPGFAASASNALNALVGMVAQIQLRLSQTEVFEGMLVELTAAVTQAASGDPVTTGVVTFYDGNSNIYETPVEADGSATFSMNASGPGTHSITARYAPSQAGFLPAESTAASLVVRGVSRATTTAVVSSKNPATSVDSVTFTAMVEYDSGPDMGSMQMPVTVGSVEFLDGTTSLGVIDLATGDSTFTTSALASGSHSITAKYLGVTEQFSASVSEALSQTIEIAKAATTTTVTFTPSTIYPSDSGLAHISVTAASGTPTGQVSINIPGQSDRTAELVNGAAEIAIPVLFPDTYQLTARYAGNTEFAPSASAPADYKISKEPISSSFATPHVSVFDGTPVNVKATFTGRFGPLSGLTVNLQFDGNLVQTLSTANDGSVSATFTGLAIGDHIVTATYAGNGGYSASTATMAISILDPNAVMATSTSLVSSANPSDTGQLVTFTATVVNSVNELDVPTGTVKFIDGADEIGAVTLVNGVATITVGLPTGGHSITAHYLGKDLYHESASAALTQIISKVSSALTLTSSSNPAQPGQEVTITVSVVGGGFAAGGTVRFFDGPTRSALADVIAGVATFSTDLLTAGTHDIRAVYSGDDNHESAEAGLQQLVSSGDPNLVSNIQEKGSPIAATSS
ncbi:MAG: Ig-like domain-containing protein [Hyphomicrobiales bacterium]